METTARYCSVLNSNLLAYVVAWIVVLNYPSPPPPCLWVCSSRQKRCHRTAEKQAEVWTSLGSITQTFLLGKSDTWRARVERPGSATTKDGECEPHYLDITGYPKLEETVLGASRYQPWALTMQYVEVGPEDKKGKGT